MKGREVVMDVKSGTFRPRWKCFGSPGKQPRIKDGFGFLSNLKNSKVQPSLKMQWIGREKSWEEFSRSQPVHPGQEQKV
jgi:hypothetical protein